MATMMDTMTTDTATGIYPSSKPAKVRSEDTAEPMQEGPSLEDLKAVVDEFIDSTADGRMLAERCRDYKDGKQWTEAQIRELKRRKQAPIVNNRIKVKHNGLLGLTSLRKADPKAFPRNVDADSGSSEAATDGLRYAADRTNLQTAIKDMADNFFCEGYGAVQIIDEVTSSGKTEVLVEHIPWARVFYDCYSQKSDFRDARDKGYGVWMDEEDILTTFPDADPDALKGQDMDYDGVFEDKVSWFARRGKYKRFLVITHYKLYRGKWIMAIYTGTGFLMPPMPSPYLDENGEPECPMEMEHAYIDRENQRYGELASFLDLQDEINHRRSKALFLLSQRQTFGNRGSVRDIKKAKRELAKPDGHLEIGQGELNKDFGLLPTGDMAQGQFELLQEAKQEMDAQSYNAQNAGDRQQGDLSGVAIGKLQSAGIVELNTLFEGLAAFRLRVYRKMWNRIRQYWDQEKWVRVTDNEKKLKWVGFNVPITMKEFLEETMADESKPQAMRLGASAQLIQLEQSSPEALQQVIEVKNKPAELDMDIVLDESFDVINASQEQLDAILKMGAQNQLDIIDLLTISNITGRDKLIEKLESRRKEAAEAAANQPPPAQDQYLQAKAAEAAAATKVKEQDATQTAIENELLKQQPTIPFKGTVSA